MAIPRSIGIAPALGGALSGLFAGVLMGVSWTLYSGFRGLGWSTPMQMVAGTFYGPLAFIGGAGVTAVGIVTFLAFAKLYGVLFAYATPRMRSSGTGLFVGIAYSIAVWAFMRYVIAAVFDATLAARVAAVPLWWFFLHWIYGAFLGMFTPWLRGLFAEEAPPQEAVKEPPLAA